MFRCEAGDCQAPITPTNCLDVAFGFQMRTMHSNLRMHMAENLSIKKGAVSSLFVLSTTQYRVTSFLFVVVPKFTTFLSVLRVFYPEITDINVRLRNSFLRSPSLLGYSGKFPHISGAGCGGRCSRHVPIRRYRAELCRQWSVACQRRPY